MLNRLYVSNYALIHDLEIEFRPGVTIITNTAGRFVADFGRARRLTCGEKSRKQSGGGSIV